jgi:microcin C transport system ATP-binding protein
VSPLLSVRELSVTFHTPQGDVEAVRRVSFDLDKGETLAIVGESGSGKSVTALSILQLLPYPQARHPSGSVRLGGRELMGASPEVLRSVRGNRVGMIFQEPMTSLNPLHRVGRQIVETLMVHRGLAADAARVRALELLDLVGIPDPAGRIDSFPHELSGGQRQRVMIAMALANEPDLLIADEPTTALDVTIQAQILALLKDLQKRFGMAILLITHDLGIVERFAGRTAVMTGGEIVEEGPTDRLFAKPEHPYTRALLAAEPKGEPLPADPDAPVVVEGRNLRVWFPIKRGVFRRTVGHVRAVDGVDFEVRKGHTLGIVGESGSGKTTLALALCRLLPSQGDLLLDSRPIHTLSGRQFRPLRREIQIVFQDPYGSLSPRLSARQIIEEGLLVHGIGATQEERDKLVIEVLREVGLDPESRHRYPHEFSGGQRQRIAIARALVLRPRVLVLDEPTSALDRSVQAQIVDLLRALKARHGLTYLFISHDLKVVRAISDEILVMKDGLAVEYGEAGKIFTTPEHPYTRELLASAMMNA